MNRSAIAATLMLALFGAPALAQDTHPLVVEGKEAYDFLCSKCHGQAMVNPGTSSYDLRKWPINDRVGFENSVLNGKDAMPAWADILEDGELEALWAYVVTRGGAEPLPADLGDANAPRVGN